LYDNRRRRRRARRRRKRGVCPRTGGRRTRRSWRDDWRRRRLSRRSGGGRPRRSARGRHKDEGLAAKTRRSVERESWSPRRGCGRRGRRRRDDDRRNRRRRGDIRWLSRRPKRLRDGLRESHPLRQRTDHPAKFRVDHQPGHKGGPLARSETHQRVMCVSDKRHERRVTVKANGQRILAKSSLKTNKTR
jgi:hypothetical protein